MLSYFKNIFLFFILFDGCVSFSQFTPGYLVLLQAGNGTSPLANTGNQILLREFSPTGAPAFSMAISTSVNPLVIGGTAVSEGGLSLTPNGKFLVFAGYATAPGFTASLSGSTASSLNRGIGIINAAGVYSRVATHPTFYSGTSIRSAGSDGAGNYWAAGGNAGANYFGINSPAATIQTSVTNTRNVMAFNSDLYFSTGSGTAGIYRVGNGFPTSAGQACSLLIGTTGNTTAPSPYSFYFNPAMSICYVADDRTPANNGGIQKWVFSANTWSLAYTLATGAAYGARAVVADFSAANPRVYATTSEGSFNRLISINDLGAGSTATNLATAPANTIFRGLAFSPFCSEPQLGTINTNGTVCAGQAFTLSVQVSGTPPLTYSWSGPGAFASSAADPVLSATVSSSYSVTVNNGCGADATASLITVNPLPLISVNASTICPGGTATLVAGGAQAYNWSNATSGNIAELSPTVTTTYTVSGFSAQGCASDALTTVTVVDTLVVSVSSTVLCLGDSVALSASGATSYTWANGSNASGITVNPGISTSYSVTGFASGCPAPALAIATVIVNQPPLVSVYLPIQTICIDDDALVLSGHPTGGIYSGNGLNGNIFDPSLTGKGNFMLVYSFTDNNSCSASDSAVVTVDLCSGLEDLSGAGFANIYPNPAKDFIYVDLKLFEETNSAKVYDGFGREVLSVAIVARPFAIDVSAISAGLYFAVISHQATRVSLKFFKE
ncbi:MAG: T9SS type A sorting domain-containing protein [Bacteroidota bacterium]